MLKPSQRCRETYLTLFVLHQILRPKSSLLQKRDEQNACLRPKKKGVLAGRCKIAVAGKENAIGGRIAVSQKGDGRVPSTVSMVKDQKRTQHKVPQRIGGRSVVSLKVRDHRFHLEVVIVYACFTDDKIW